MFSVTLQEAIGWRRSLHHCPQPAWLEFYATSFIAEKLSAWGYRVQMGREIIDGTRQLLLPTPEKLASEMERVQSRGGQAMFTLFGAPTAGGHHNEAFDIDEYVIHNAAEFLVKMHKAVTTG